MVSTIMTASSLPLLFFLLSSSYSQCDLPRMVDLPLANSKFQKSVD